MEGVTISQFIREATLARAYYGMGVRGEAPLGGDDLIPAVRKVLEEQDMRRRPRDDE